MLHNDWFDYIIDNNSNCFDSLCLTTFMRENGGAAEQNGGERIITVIIAFSPTTTITVNLNNN